MFASIARVTSRLRSADLPDGSPIMPGPAADDHDRPAAVALEVHQPEDRDEVARRGATARTDRTRCRPPIGARVASRASRPGVRSWSSPRHASSASRPARIEGARARRVTGGAGETSERAGRGETCPSPIPMLSWPTACKPASRGVSAIGETADDRSGGAALQGRHRASPVPLRDLRPARSRRFVGAVAPTATTARACRTPRAPRQPRIRPADGRLRSDRQGRAGPLRPASSARSSTFDQIPP